MDQEGPPGGSCPLCGEELAAEETSKDHVFGKAFGGRIHVLAHRRCNNTVGHTSEAHLSSHNSLLSIARRREGLDDQPFRGTEADGTRIDIDPRTGEPSQWRPEVSVTDSDGRRTFQVSGSETSVRGVLEGWRSRHGDGIPVWEDLPADAISQASREVGEITLSFVIDLNASASAAAKIALEAGVVAFGISFADTSLANGLRQVLTDGLAGTTQLVDATAPSALDEVLAGIAEEMFSAGAARVPVPLLAAPNPVNDVVFAPERGRTMVFVRLLGVNVLTAGLVVDGDLPPDPELGLPAAPVLVREVGADLQVIHFTRLIADVQLSMP